MKLLVLTNDTTDAPAPGMRDGYRLLADSGEIESVHFVSWREERPEHVVAAVQRDDWDTLVVWSPRTFPAGGAQGSQLEAAIAGRSVIVWEGDHWSSSRISEAARRFWLPRADHLFNSAGSSSIDRFAQAGARQVHTTISGYDHVQFAAAESRGPEKRDGAATAVMIASNPPSWPRRLARPGALARMRLAWLARKNHRGALTLHGSGWPAGWSAGSVPFAQQVDVIRDHGVSVIWDHYPALPLAYSNRLAISALAGRPHIGTLHPDSEWLSEQTPGVFLEKNVSTASARLDDLLSQSPESLHELGVAAFEWARHRLDQRSLVRFIVSGVDSTVTPPEGEPWDTLRNLNDRFNATGRG